MYSEESSFSVNIIEINSPLVLTNNEMSLETTRNKPIQFKTLSSVYGMVWLKDGNPALSPQQHTYIQRKSDGIHKKKPQSQNNIQSSYMISTLKVLLFQTFLLLKICCKLFNFSRQLQQFCSISILKYNKCFRILVRIITLFFSAMT